MSWYDDEDDDAPRRRDWGGTDPHRITRAFKHRAGDTSKRIDDALPLSEIMQPALPPPARPQRAPDPEPTPWVEIHLHTDDGMPVAGARIKISDGSQVDNEFETEVTTDHDGIARTDVRRDVRHAVNLVDPVDLSKIPLADPPQTRADAQVLLTRSDCTEPTRIAACRPISIVLERPRATIVSLDGWIEGQAVLVFGSARKTGDDVVTVRAILRTALALVGSRRIFVVGHADTKGGQDDNDALAAERATSVALFLSGERDAWAQHAYDNANMTTLKSALAWAARATGIPCDPGQVAPGWNAATAKALDHLREAVGSPIDAKYGPGDWAAIYDLYDDELASILYMDRSSLQSRKEALLLSDDDCGERWPVDAPEIDGYASSTNRRVDLVICQPSRRPLTTDSGSPQQKIDEIYDGTFVLEHVPVPPEAKIRLHSVTTTLVSVGNTCMSIVIGSIVATLVADDLGLVEFTALRGEKISVIACTDLWSASRIVWGTFGDLSALQGNKENDT